MLVCGWVFWKDFVAFLEHQFSQSMFEASSFPTSFPSLGISIPVKEKRSYL